MFLRNVYIGDLIGCLMPWKFRRKFAQCLYSVHFLLLLTFISFISATVSCIEADKLTTGLFPKSEDLSMFKPVRTSSTCGINKKSDYCMSSLEDSSIKQCKIQTCILQCCKNCRSVSANYTNLDKDGKFVGNVFLSVSNLRPGSPIFGESKDFKNGYVQTKNRRFTYNFTFTSWLNQKYGNQGVILEKPGSFLVVLQKYMLKFVYFSKDSPTTPKTIDFKSIDFEQGQWHHFGIKVCNKELDLFIDGVFVRSERLYDHLMNATSLIRIAHDTSDYGQYIGLTQDMRYYEEGLTNREITEAMTGTLPIIPHTMCRCPESHPRLSPTSYFYCMKNDASAAGDLVQRLGENAHPAEYLVDRQVTYWISEIPTNQVTIELDLKFNNLEIYLVHILFYSPPPRGIKIERSTDFAKTYSAWQYYAINCSMYNLPSNGQLAHPNSVNCLQMKNVKPSWENVMFKPSSPGDDGSQVKRPYGVTGCADIHCSPLWLDFVRATNVRLTLTGHSLQTHVQHQYFAIRQFIVVGRCDCYGHSLDCTYLENTEPHAKFICQCDPRTFTQGDQCEKCLPLYNEKPFKRGTIFSANACIKCECHGHADSCTYAASLDPNPASRDTPGGGVCQRCKHNTIGRNCDSCVPLYYRPSDKKPSDVDACQPCNCIGPGIVPGVHTCQMDDSITGVLAGQCTCKKYVTGRQCTRCIDGYYQLSANTPQGCISCGCHLPGTQGNGLTCQISTGQCTCKQNVLGLKCTQCKTGYYGLSYLNPLGCYPCNCNPLGSNSPTTCHVTTGQCKCRDKFEGLACDQCVAGHYGPNCLPCYCAPAGTTGFGSECNKNDGQCACKKYVTGASCDRCISGYYGLSATNPDGCSPCNCEVKGTLNNQGKCNQTSGECFCKKFVVGAQCSLCKVGTHGLGVNNVDGCKQCQCSARGTVSGHITPQDELVCTHSGQCNCLTNVIGQKCDQCAQSFFSNPTRAPGCVACECHPSGAKSSLCDTTSGQCFCHTSRGVGGKKCDQCLSGYYGFNDGSCTQCACGSGSLGQTCTANGTCTRCKQNVAGEKCDVCKPATVQLDKDNPYGCSGVPSNQPTPYVTLQTPRSLTLQWQPPGEANGTITKYELYRNTTAVYVGLLRKHQDTNLTPYTVYKYYVVVYTPGGFSRSVKDLVVRTESDIPEGLSPGEITAVTSRSVTVSWKPPSQMNGELLYYKLLSSNVLLYRGKDLSHRAVNLAPFTSYTFKVQACTSKGCTESDGVTVQTLTAAPDSQPAPYLNPLDGGQTVNVSWDLPTQPNGVVQFFSISLRGTPFQGDGIVVANKLKPSLRLFSVTNLQPYTEYELRITTFTSNIKATSSKWAKTRTKEAVPSGESSIRTTTTAVNNSAIHLSWSDPFTPNGVIVSYKLHRRNPQPVVTVTSPQYTDVNLQAYTNYTYSVQACNTVGCTNRSSAVTQRTAPSVPEGQPSPRLISSSASAVTLSWDLPLSPNGPAGNLYYVVEQMLPCFSYPPPSVEQGVRFPGFGFYRLDAATIPDSATSKIEMHFRTRFLDGLLLFACSRDQRDIMVVEFREGCPWFVFDTESGAAAFTISKNRTFNDNNWHHLLITRNSREGSITIDNTYTGSGNGRGTQNVIGQIESVFVGGMPTDFQIKRRDYGPTTLKRMSYIGCIRNLKYKNQPVDFHTSLQAVNVPSLTSYCRQTSTPGLYFKGGGHLLLKPGVLIASGTFSLKLRLKTLKETSLLVYLYGFGVRFSVFIKTGVLYLKYKTMSRHGLYALSAVKMCDGAWHSVIIQSTGGQLSATIDNKQKQVTFLPSDFVTSSQIYVGGIPAGDPLHNLLLKDDVVDHFSGCLQDINIATVVFIQSNVDVFENVEFDGCPQTPENAVTCKNPPLLQVYDGRKRQTEIGNLHAFTEYLFRVKSSHDNQTFTASPWSAVKAGQGAPGQLATPSIVQIGAHHVQLAWIPPAISGGLITHYLVHAYIPKVGRNTSATFYTINGKLSGLEAATLYSFTVEVFTSGGSTESDVVIATTLPAAPEGFKPPVIISTPTSLNITWQPPSKTNGEITSYTVTIDNVLQYTGLALHHYVENLKVYTKYTLKVCSCGKVGCSCTETVTFTGQRLPEAMAAPQLQVLGSHRVRVTWHEPAQANGKIVFYELYVSLSSSVKYMTFVYNATADQRTATLGNLVAGTVYYVRLKAYNSAGGTLGDATSIRTLESAPADIPKPQVTQVGSTILLVKILPPAKPNGVIKSYKLYQDSVLVLERGSLPSDYVAKGLQEYTDYTFQVEVCTASGCGFSDKMIARTGEGDPEGTVRLQVLQQLAHSVTIKYESLDLKPNGVLVYRVYVNGEFYDGYRTSVKARVCYEGDAVNHTTTCNSLLAFTDYSIIVNASNSAGYILSDEANIKTLPSAPEGLDTAVCDFVNSTSISVSWSAPRRANGVIRSYTLYARTEDPIAGFREMKLKTGLFFNYAVAGLTAYTEYSFRVLVENDQGSTASPWKNITTSEDVPSQFDSVKVTAVDSRYAWLAISRPAEPNGIITAYRVYLNDTFYQSLLNTSVKVKPLTPFTSYVVKASACTSVGCVNSSSVSFKTLPDVPQGVLSPVLEANGSRSVIIRWSQPTMPNGIMRSYSVQRRVKLSTSITTVANQPAQFWNMYVDFGVLPYTTYEYRIIAETEAGGTPSPYGSVTTPQGAPSGVEAPVAFPLSATSVLVQWNPPKRNNGEMSHYVVAIGDRTIRINGPLTFQHTVTALTPYVLYMVKISACTPAGCTDSPAVNVRTLPSVPNGQKTPQAVPVSESALRVAWSQPDFPNGPIKTYKLETRTIKSVVNQNITLPTKWSAASKGIATQYQHSSLGIFSQHQYRVTCMTSEGETTSNVSLVYRTLPAVPLRGPQISASVLNHTSVLVSWSDPSIQLLRGQSEKYTLTYELTETSTVYTFAVLNSTVKQIVIDTLKPSTSYDIRVEVFNGAGSFTSEAVRLRTTAGTPEGFEAPIVYSIGSFDARISWSHPKVANGPISNYTIVVNDVMEDTVNGDVTFHQQKNLKPYTKYSVKIRVCTVYACILSEHVQTTTLSAAPSRMLAPQFDSVTSTSLVVRWRPPMDLNGALVGYQVFRRHKSKCSQGGTLAGKCAYVKCLIHQQLCGNQCYDPKFQTCCGTKLHQRNVLKSCCDGNYLYKQTTFDVCCGGSFHKPLSDHQCCFGSYVNVPNGQVCCGASSGGLVIKTGDKCCGEQPYDSRGTKTCLCGALYDKEPATRQCCGGKIISTTDVCCGNHVQGVGYKVDARRSCCGVLYTKSANRKCCKSSHNQTKVHTFDSQTALAAHKCCGTDTIPVDQSCCNNKGYDNATTSCADRDSTGTYSSCGNGTTCTTGPSFCDQCSFDTSKHVCLKGRSVKHTDDSLCFTVYVEVLQNSRDPSINTFTDSNLLPHTVYEYYVQVTNDAGSAKSPTNSTKTAMARPENLNPPTASVDSSRQITVSWAPPLIMNGNLAKYILYRIKWPSQDTRLIYEGLSTSFVDNDVEAYTGYAYIISACTLDCTNSSTSSLAYTHPDIPSGVVPPLLTPLTSAIIQVNWTEPESPNGKIILYNATILIAGKFRPIHASTELTSIEVSGLQPFTQYVFRLEVCTIVGCAQSHPANATTLQGAPGGMKPPQVAVINARKVEVVWTPPEILNGVIQNYVVTRNNTVVYDNKNTSFVDSNVLPNSVYSYTVEAFTKGGGTKSESVVVKTPESSPEGIVPPNVVALSSTSFNASWSPPISPNGVVTAYSVLFQHEGGVISKRYAGVNRWLVVDGLQVFTIYEVRLEACTSGGCGTSGRVSMRTLEEPPTHQPPPRLQIKSATIVEIFWGPPNATNGVITSYQVERRHKQAPSPYVIYVGARTDYIDTQLAQFTEYEYRVISMNTKGRAVSAWAKVVTSEGVPENLAPPTVIALNSTAVQVSWQPPGKPNGVLLEYTVRSRLLGQSAAQVARCCVPVHTNAVNISGFKPFTMYEVQIVATTAKGSGYSGWSFVQLDEDLPSGVPEIFVNRDHNVSGSLELYWGDVQSSNGVITSYILYNNQTKVYEGLSKRAIIRDIQPATNYTFQLKVCNSKGCIAGDKQVVNSGPDRSKVYKQPEMVFMNSSVVHLKWSLPSQLTVTKLEIVRVQDASRKRRSADDVIYETTDLSQVSFVDDSVTPFTKYRYRLRMTTPDGVVETEWLSVTTPQGIPDGLAKPNLTALAGPSVRIEWQAPSSPNGVIKHYEVLRNGTSLGSTSSLTYTDSHILLQASTYYAYAIRACTIAGCRESSISVVQTLLSPADRLQPPALQALDAYRIRATWVAPADPNGDIAKYQLFRGNSIIPVFEGYAFTYTVRNLKPFTVYTFKLSACTFQGCAESRSSNERTLEAPPKNVYKPLLYVLGATTIEVRWSSPGSANGVIRYYVLKRDNSVVYNGTEKVFVDYSLQPNTRYGYSVTAYNSAGGTESPVAYSTSTNTGAPQNVSAPVLRALSSTSIHASWVAPDSPNAAITSYSVLFLNFDQNVGMTFTYEAKNLEAYTIYGFRVKACTNTACATSPVSMARTLEDTPVDQRAPYFVSGEVTYSSITARWDHPLKPNGKIVSCRLSRRRQSETIVHVYSGLSKSYVDRLEIRANTAYEYRVVCNNSMGGAHSPWSLVTTSIAPPQQVRPLIVTRIGSTSFSYVIEPPDQPNGEIVSYTIQIDTLDTTRNETNVTLSGDIDGLLLNKEYTLLLYACNKAGCGVSTKSSTILTRPSPPQSVPQPQLLWTTARQAGLKWLPPKYPNGQIERYDVIIEHPCPQASKPSSCVVKTVTLSAGLLTEANITNLAPYTRYAVNVSAHNKLGGGSSPPLLFKTQAEAPMVLSAVSVEVVDTPPNTVVLDWGASFDLRSALQEFVVRENKAVVYVGKNTTISLPNKMPGYYSYTVTAVTRVNNDQKSVVTPEITVAVGSVPTTTTTAKKPTAGKSLAGKLETTWYESVWFLALAAIFAALLIFLVIICCCRGYRNNSKLDKFDWIKIPRSPRKFAFIWTENSSPHRNFAPAQAKFRTVYVRQREPLPVKVKRPSRPPSALSMSPAHQRAVDRYNTIPLSRKSTPRNSVYENSDLIWDTGRDSGLYDDFSPTFYEENDIEFAGTDGRMTQHSLRLPDTRL